MSSDDRRKKKPYSWSVWDPETSLTGALGIDSMVDEFLVSAAEDEQRQRQRTQETLEALTMMRKNQIEDELREQRRQAEEMRQRMQEEAHRQKMREIEEEERRKKAELERPQKTIDNFWILMNNGIQYLTHAHPNFPNAISSFQQAARLMKTEIQFLVTATKNYTMMMNDLSSLAETYSHLCQAMIEFNRDSDCRQSVQSSLNEMGRTHGAMEGLYPSVKSMCDAYLEEENRDRNFRIAVDLVPNNADSGAIILVLMALTLNRKEKKYDELIDELYQKLRI